MPFQICDIFDNPLDSYWAFQSLFLEILDQQVRTNEPPFIKPPSGKQSAGNFNYINVLKSSLVIGTRTNTGNNETLLKKFTATPLKLTYVRDV